jgi:outer membrane scaffolding protein for murein synthesis (MipA/OmpV family)
VWQLAAALSLIAAPTVLLAQTPSPLPEWTYSAGQLMRTSLSPKVPEWSVFTGLSAAYAPRYDGGSDRHLQIGPSFDVRYGDLAFAATGEGIGVNALRGKNYRSGLAISFDLGRRAQDSNDTQGLGNINVAPELKFFAEYLIFPVMLRADVRHAFGGYRGWIGDFSAYMPVYGTKKFYVFVGPSVTFADNHYMSSYFGVTPTQSADSGYSQFSAHAGLKSVNAAGSATWMVTDHWLLNIIAGGQRLMDDAARSPLSLDRINYSTTFTVGYTF